MKLFNRLPRWLRFFGLATLVALCLGINAIAFTELYRLLNRSPPTEAALTQTTKLKISPIRPAPPPVATVNLPASGSTTRPANIGTPTIPASPAVANKAKASPLLKPSATVPTPIPAPASNPPKPSAAQPKYGHRPYTAPNPAGLVQVASYPEGKTQRAETMHPEAAKALLDMVAAARADGIWLVPASGFRTFAQQRTLFNAQVAKLGSPEAAAKVSAPPGYSEHHTGYAIDLTDGSFAPNQDISLAFATSPAYQWLTDNAATYGFELSFLENNPQGISFEPWHWRYVGSAKARAIFGKSEPPRELGGASENIIE